MQGCIATDEDAWLYHKWKPEVDVDSLLQATLPPGLVEDEVDTYEALVLAGTVSILILYLVDDGTEKRICVWLSAFCMMSYVRER